MNKPNIFYEDNKLGKKRLTFLAVLLSICIFGWSLALIFSFIITPTDIPQNSFEHNLLENIFTIIFLAILLAFDIFLYVFRSKSLRFKYTISITEDEFIFAIPVKRKNIFKSEDFLSYEITEKINQYAKVNLIFVGEEKNTIITHKFDKLKVALDYLINEKKQI